MWKHCYLGLGRGALAMGLWSLVQVLSLWDFGTLALGHSGLLALLPTWLGVLVGPGDVGPTRGLGPKADGGPLMEIGSHAGMSASLGSTLWDSFLNRHVETENCTH